MTETYETLTAFARSAGTLYCFALFLGVLVYALWPWNRDKFNQAARAAAQRGLSHGHDRNSSSRQDHRPDHHRTRVGRHPRAQHAAAALVAVDASMRRSLFAVVYWVALSGLAAGATATLRGLLGYTNRTQVAADVAAIQAQRAADRGAASRPRASPRSRATRSC